MKTEKLKSELAKLEQALKNKIKITKNSADIAKIKIQDISAWKNNKRNWTWNKILDIAEKFDL